MSGFSNKFAVRPKGNDIYYRMAKEQGWRARSAFKLLEIDEKFAILSGVKKAVDLCAAPGSWSQVLSRRLYLGEIIEWKLRLFDDHVATKALPTKNDDVKIVAVDLQPLLPLPGVIQLQGDITDNKTAEAIIAHLEGERADLVVCDGAPDVTGLHGMDMFLQRLLLLGALHIACSVLRLGGTFVVKIFWDKESNMLTNQLLSLFKEVSVVKPESSREFSIEAFAVCRMYNPPVGFDPKLIASYISETNFDFSILTGVNQVIIPFLVCGDTSACDQFTRLPRQLDGDPQHDGSVMSASDFEELRKLLNDAVGDEAFLCRDTPILDYGGQECKKISNTFPKSDNNKIQVPFVSTLKESQDLNENNFQRLTIRQDGSDGRFEGSEFSVIEDSHKFS